jgi:hypothetical protein
VVSVSAHPRINAAAALLTSCALLATPALALAKPKHDDGASEGTRPCSILTPGMQSGVITTLGHYTIAANGNGTLVCRGQVPDPPPRTVHLDGLRCPTPAGVTWRSHTVITKSGRVTLTCHFKAKDGR